MKNNKRCDIVVIKFVALILVSLAHLVSTTTFALDIPGVIRGGELSEPILTSDTHALWKLETFIFEKFNIQYGVLGVVLFFLVSGYFIPNLQNIYNKKFLYEREPKTIPHILFSRLKKFYPTVVIAVILNGLIAFLFQGIKYRLYDYIGTASLIGKFIPNFKYTMEIIWYLEVLVFVYFIASIFPKISLKNLTGVYGILIVLVIIPYVYISTCHDGKYISIMLNIRYLACYSGIPFLGTAFFISKNINSKIERICVCVYYFILNMCIVKLNAELYNDVSTYSEINTYITAFLIIFVIYLLNYFIPKMFSFLMPFIEFFDKISFAFYLLHVHFGVITIYYLRLNNFNPYLCVVMGYIVSIIISIIVSKIAIYISESSFYKKIGENYR